MPSLPPIRRTSLLTTSVTVRPAGLRPASRRLIRAERKYPRPRLQSRESSLTKITTVRGIRNHRKPQSRLTVSQKQETKTINFCARARNCLGQKLNLAMDNGSSCKEENGASHGAPHRSRPFKVKSWGRTISIRNTKPSTDEEQELLLGKNFMSVGAADRKIVCPPTSNDVVLVESIKFASRLISGKIHSSPVCSYGIQQYTSDSVQWGGHYNIGRGVSFS